MFRKLVLSTVFALSSLSAFADVDLRTTITDVQYRGACERAGVINFNVDGNEFAEASETDPVYMRLRLDHGAVLCQTLVSENGGQAPIHLPAALELGYGSEGDTVNIAPDGVSIVRWVQGEPEIWIKITDDSNDWIRSGDQLLPPSPERVISFTIGIDGATSQATNEMLFQMQRANLAASLQNNAVADTLLNVDLSNSNLEPRPAPLEDSALNFDPITFDSQTSNVESSASFRDITLGQLTSVAFSDDRTIARAFNDDVIDPPPTGDIDVELRTTIREVHIQNDNQTTGMVQFYLDADEFAEASPENPIYIRMRLERGATLADDRVEPGADHAPIYLPIILDGPEGYTVAAPATAVSVVRWKAGEHEVWLKITEATSSWLRNSSTGQLESPSYDNPVFFNIGLSASRSMDDAQDAFQQGHANLPFQTTKGTRNLPSDLSFTVDLREAYLEPLPAPQDVSALGFDPIAFDSQTEGVEQEDASTGINLGQLQPIPFSDDRVIARAFASHFGSNMTLSGNSRALDYDKNNQRLGAVKADFTGDIFRNTEGEFPLSLPPGFSLSKTLVGEGDAPINVALKVRNGAEAGIEMVAAENAVTITRWVAGETFIILDVNQKSDEWLRLNGQLVAPSEQNQVRMVLGNSASGSLRSFLRKYNAGLANLPANMKINDANGLPQAADTRARVDLDRAQVGVGSVATWTFQYSGEVANVGQIEE